MKKPFLGLLLLAAWLTSFAANATTYTYDVDHSFTTTGGDVTGFITTSCDNCILTASNLHAHRRHGRRGPAVLQRRGEQRSGLLPHGGTGCRK
jgi:hypothetical protein